MEIIGGENIYCFPDLIHLNFKNLISIMMYKFFLFLQHLHSYFSIILGNNEMYRVDL